MHCSLVQMHHQKFEGLVIWIVQDLQAFSYFRDTGGLCAICQWIEFYGLVIDVR